MTLKRNFLRLCLMLGLLSLNSCRQDLLPEQDTYNNSGAFQLTSKRISLNEAQHKINLIPKIEQVETNLYTESKNNLQGKTVNFGNGISIDTDDVIYLEKGPDFHSYTFRINHENAPDNAPIENLVISSRPDGTWKEVLVTYYLTPLERQNLLSGGAVDFTGKVTHETLQNGTYSSAIMQQDVMNCHMEISTYYTRCGGNEDHHNGELPKSQNGPCTTDTPSVLVVSLVRKCTIALPVDTGLGEDGEGGGSGPQNGPGGLSNNPPEETTTAPNLPTSSEDPCMKTRVSIRAANTVLKNSEVQTKMNTVLGNKSTEPIEYAVALGMNNGAYDVTAPNPGTPTNSETPVWNLANPSSFFGDGHAHSGGPANPSAGDLYGMLEEIVKPNSSFQVRFVYGVSNGVKEVYSLVVNDKSAAIAFLAAYPRAKNYDPVTHGFLKGSDLWKEIEQMKSLYSNKSNAIDNSGEYYNPPSVGLAYMLEHLNSGMSIAKVDANGNLKKINASTEKIGNDERAKISKCP